MRTTRRSAVLATAALSVMLLLLAACGSDDGGSSTTGEISTVEEDGGLPTAGDDGGSPAVAGTCLEGEPDCEDTVVSGGTCVEDEPDCEDTVAEPIRELPNNGGEAEDGAVTQGGMTVDGGLSVAEALQSSADGVIAVRGHAFDDGSGPVLCESVATGSGTPTCGGAVLPLENIDITEAVDITSSGGVTYSAEEVTLFGELVDGALEVDPTVMG